MLFCDCVQDYFRTYLMMQRGYGANTIGSYRDTFRLLLAYMGEAGLSMESLEMADMDRGLVTGFLCWLESSRGNSASCVLSSMNFGNYHLFLSGVPTELFRVLPRGHGPTRLRFLAVA